MKNLIYSTWEIMGRSRQQLALEKPLSIIRDWVLNSAWLPLGTQAAYAYGRRWILFFATASVPDQECYTILPSAGSESMTWSYTSYPEHT